MNRSTLKRSIDVLMTLLLLFLMGYQFWGDAAHEWAGAAMFLLFLLHQYLNAAWYRNIFRGRYTPFRILQLAVNILTFASMLMLMYSGIRLSRHVFTFIPAEGSLSLARSMHILGSHWGFLLMSIHLGLHWNMVISGMKLKDRTSRFPYLLPVLGACIAAYGIFVFIRRDFPTYLLLGSEFVFLDYEESRLLFYLDYISLMGLCIFISHYGARAIRRLRRK